MNISAKPTVDDMQVGVAKLSNHLVSLSLSGALNFWKLDEITEEAVNISAPSFVFDGHRKAIIGVYYNEGRLMTVDMEGKICKFFSLILKK